MPLFILCLLGCAVAIALFLAAKLLRSYPIVLLALLFVIASSVLAIMDDKILLGVMWLSFSAITTAAAGINLYKNKRGAFWWSLGGLFGLIAAAVPYEDDSILAVVVPLGVFFVVGFFGSLIFPRLVYKNKEERNHITNFDRIIGQRVQISQDKTTGRSQRGAIGDVDWAIEPLYPYEKFEVGDVVKVKEIKGVTLLCVRDGKDAREKARDKRKEENEQYKAQAAEKRQQREEAKKLREEEKAQERARREEAKKQREEEQKQKREAELAQKKAEQDARKAAEEEARKAKEEARKAEEEAKAAEEARKAEEEAKAAEEARTLEEARNAADEARAKEEEARKAEEEAKAAEEARKAEEEKALKEEAPEEVAKEEKKSLLSDALKEKFGLLFLILSCAVIFLCLLVIILALIFKAKIMWLFYIFFVLVLGYAIAIFILEVLKGKDKELEEVAEEPTQEETPVEEAPAEEPVAEEPAPAPAPKEKPEFVPFNVRLEQADDFLRNAYNELKSEALSYGLKSRVSSTSDTFRLHTKTYIKMVVAGKYLKLFFALNPEDYKDTTYPFEDASKLGTRKDIPFVFKIKSGLSIRRAKVLMSDVVRPDGLEQGEVIPHDHFADIKGAASEEDEEDAE